MCNRSTPGPERANSPYGASRVVGALDSNQEPPAFHTGALPIELTAHEMRWQGRLAADQRSPLLRWSDISPAISRAVRLETLRYRPKLLPRTPNSGKPEGQARDNARVS